MDAGVSTVRLDAIGYAVKQPGSDSFMTGEILAYVEELVATCHERGLEVLVEVHSHYSLQLRIDQSADRIYAFALPPLLLHAVYTSDLAPLGQWLALRPDTAISVLDTHDGIGVVDACKGEDGTPGFFQRESGGRDLRGGGRPYEGPVIAGLDHPAVQPTPTSDQCDIPQRPRP